MPKFSIGHVKRGKKTANRYYTKASLLDEPEAQPTEGAVIIIAFFIPHMTYTNLLMQVIAWLLRPKQLREGIQLCI